MMEKRLLSLLLSFLCICLSAQGRGQNYTDYYDLGFQFHLNESPGDADGLADGCRSSWLVDGNSSLDVMPIPIPCKRWNEDVVEWKYASVNHCPSVLFQRILLPKVDNDEGRVELECAGSQMDRVRMTVSGLDSKEDVLWTKSEEIPVDTSLGRCVLPVSYSGTELLDIRLSCLPKDSDSYMVFSKMSIFIGEKNIDDYPLFDYFDDKRPIVPKRKLVRGIPDRVYESKILGIGESVHFCPEVQGMAVEMILDAVRRHDCRLVLMEGDIINGLRYDRYVNGREMEMDSSELSLNDKLPLLLEELRKINETRETGRRVHVFGIDEAIERTPVNIFNYLFAINHEAANPAVDSLSLLVLKDKAEGPEETDGFLLRRHSELSEILSYSEIATIKSTMEDFFASSSLRSEQHAARDSLMARNAIMYVNMFDGSPDETVAVYAHSVHINDVSPYPSPICRTLGSYLTESFGESYKKCSILPLLDTSDTSGRADDVLPLLDPPEFSVEYELRDCFDKTPFYLDASCLDPHIVLSRFLGASFVYDQFFPMNLSIRFDGLVFVLARRGRLKNPAHLEFEEVVEKDRIRRGAFRNQVTTVVNRLQ